jgi:uroporphyrinogen decarboxylase
VDAAVFFSDIVVPFKAAGVEVEIVPDVGPVMGTPVRTAAQARALPRLEPDQLAPIVEAIGIVTDELGATPLIGFAGAPFTLAAYLIEGRPSRDYLNTKALMYSDPDTWDAILSWAADVSATFLRTQILSGASVVQLFDSWAGALSLADYIAYVQPYSARVLASVADLDVPRIHFGVATGELLVAMREAGADVMGVDHRIPLDVANVRLGGTTPLQGNIDPAMLFTPWAVLRAHVDDCINRGKSAPAHILNLGHGVPPSTDPEVLTRLVAYVHGDQ